MPDRSKTQPRLSATSYVYPVRSLFEGRIQPHIGEQTASPAPTTPADEGGFFNLQNSRFQPIPQSVSVDAIIPPFAESSSSAATPNVVASGSSQVHAEASLKQKGKGTRRRSTSTSAVPDPESPRQEGDPTATIKGKRRKSGRKSSPNFRHFPAGDNPYFPRSFSRNKDPSAPSTPDASTTMAGDMIHVPSNLSAAHILGHRHVEPEPPLSSRAQHLAGDSSVAESPSLRSEPPLAAVLARSEEPESEEPTPEAHEPQTPMQSFPATFMPFSGLADPLATPVATQPGEAIPDEEIEESEDDVPSLPFNPSLYGFVHLPPRPSSAAGSDRASPTTTSSRSHSAKSGPSGRSRPHPPSQLSARGSVAGSDPSESNYQSFPSSSGGQFSQTESSQGSQNDSSLGKSDGSTDSLTSDEAYMTFKFQYHEDENGHHVVIGREGKLQSCEDEPIRTPGAVQGFGVLIAVDELEDTLVVRQVSENATEILGLPPQYLFGLECFTDTLPESQVGILWDNIQFLSEPDQAEEEEGSPHVFLLSGFGAPGSAYPNEGESDDGKRMWTCWCAVHRAQAYNTADSVGSGLVVMEFELERDAHNPLYPPIPPPSFAQSSGGESPTASYAGSSTATAGSGKTLVDSRPRFSSPVSDNSTVGGSSASGSSVGGSSTTGSTPSLLSDTNPTPNNSLVTDPSNSVHGLDGDEGWVPSAEDILESTTSRSRPLPALERLRRMTRTGAPYGSAPGEGPGAADPSLRRRAGRRGRGATTVGMMDVFAVMAQINDQLGSAPDLDTFLKVVVGVIKDLTQFHRVMVYQFDEMWNGQTVAELVDWSQSHDLFKGLHFPAGDIPAQARELYTINKVRILYDRALPTARIVVRDKYDLERPLNMTHCYLRAMSPIHIKYLENMGVRASMSVSIMAFGQLWGLVTCHSYGEHGMRVSFPVRQMLRLLSQSISKNIERLSYAQRLHTRKLINTMASAHHPTGYIVSNADDLRGLFDADFGILVIGEGAKILGPNQHGQEILIMAEYLRLKQFDTIQASQAVVNDYPDLELSTGFETIAGLLYVPLSSGGRDFIAFLRRGQPRQVHWAGKPYKDANTTTAKLEPRKSFKIWSETVAGRCRAWTDEQLETAGVLALVYGKFIEVWRQKENALQTTKLTNLLLSNASHEVRTPLNHIINYLEMAMNGPLDGETRDNLSRSHAASKSLLFTINDLLDLTRLESGNETSFNETFDLHFAIEEATNLYRKEASRRDIEFILDLAESPMTVVGDSKKIRTVVQNLTANALKYTMSGSITVCCTTFGEPEGLRSTDQTAVEIIVADTGCGIPPEKLESIFREFEQVESSEPKTSGEAGVGLGLAVVARIVEQLGGQLRVDSKVDEGSRFSFLIPLSLSNEGLTRSGGTSRSSGSSKGSVYRSLEGTRAGSLTAPSGEHDIENLVQALSSNHMSNSRESLRNSLEDAKSIEEAHSPNSGARQQSIGRFEVTDSSIPVRPIKVDDFEQETSRSNPSPYASPRISLKGTLSSQPMTPSSMAPSSAQTTATSSSMTTSYFPSSSPAPLSSLNRADSVTAPGKLRVLIVEDNDINRTILAKRLTLFGHTVVNTTNGQEGLDEVMVDQLFDLVLMDIQMPILNGFEATRGIRRFEKEQLPPTRRLSQTLNGRLPIFAVSASLLEQQRDELSDYGLDGWILKPIDFKRLSILLKGITDPEQRERDVYQQGCSWEAGGWLKHRLDDNTTYTERGD